MAEINGRPAEPGELQALALTNYGHFTSFRVEDGRVRGLDLHLQRLDRDCRALFGTGLDADHIRTLVRRVVPQQGASMVRVTVFDPGMDLARPSAARSPHILVTKRPVPAVALPPIRVRSFPYVRDSPEIKSVGLFGSVWRRRRAQDDGFDDALFVAPDGQLGEGSTWNVGFVDGARVVWPAADCLTGVTMRLLQDATHMTRPITLAEAASMEVAFATSAGVGVRLISRIDDLAFADQSPVMAEIREKYLAIKGDPL